MSYVNQIKDRNNVADVHDKRLEVTAADAGKVVTVNENGELSLADSPNLYQYIFTLYNTQFDGVRDNQPWSNIVTELFIEIWSNRKLTEQDFDDMSSFDVLYTLLRLQRGRVFFPVMRINSDEQVLQIYATTEQQQPIITTYMGPSEDDGYITRFYDVESCNLDVYDCKNGTMTTLYEV